MTESQSLAPTSTVEAVPSLSTHPLLDQSSSSSSSSPIPCATGSCTSKTSSITVVVLDLPSRGTDEPNAGEVLEGLVRGNCEDYKDEIDLATAATENGRAEGRRLDRIEKERAKEGGGVGVVGMRRSLIPMRVSVYPDSSSCSLPSPLPSPKHNGSQGGSLRESDEGAGELRGDHESRGGPSMTQRGGSNAESIGMVMSPDRHVVIGNGGGEKRRRQASNPIKGGFDLSPAISPVAMKLDVPKGVDRDGRASNEGEDEEQDEEEEKPNKNRRPSLTTYTSFHSSFDIAPPPSPPPSPKGAPKSWWRGL